MRPPHHLVRSCSAHASQRRAPSTTSLANFKLSKGEHTNGPRRQQIQPSRQPIPRLRQQHLHHRGRLGIIRASQILALHNRNSVFKHRTTNKRIRVGRPTRRRGHRVINIDALQPCSRHALVGAALDAGGEGGSELVRIGESRRASDLLGNRRIP